MIPLLFENFSEKNWAVNIVYINGKGQNFEAGRQGPREDSSKTTLPPINK